MNINIHGSVALTWCQTTVLSVAYRGVNSLKARELSGAVAIFLQGVWGPHRSPAGPGNGFWWCPPTEKDFRLLVKQGRSLGISSGGARFSPTIQNFLYKIRKILGGRLPPNPPTPTGYGPLK